MNEENSALEKDVNEGLPNYWNAISGIEQKLWYATEIYNRQHLKMQNISDDALENLRTHKRHKDMKFIKGVSNYNILSNMSY